MARLPSIGGDTAAWGTILNDYLSVAHASDGTPLQPSVATFGHPGSAVVGAGTGRFLFAQAATITGVIAAANTAPTGAALIFDVNKNGTTIFSTQANRPQIAASAYKTSSTAVPNVTAVASGDYLTVDIDQVGSTIAGSDISVFVLYR